MCLKIPTSYWPKTIDRPPLTRWSIFLQRVIFLHEIIRVCPSLLIYCFLSLYLTLSVSGIVFYLLCSLSLISSQIAAGVQSHAVNTNYYQQDPKLGHSTRCHVKNIKHTHAGKGVSIHSKTVHLQTCWHRHISSCLLLWMSVHARHVAFVLCVKHLGCSLCVLSCVTHNVCIQLCLVSVCSHNLSWFSWTLLLLLVLCYLMFASSECALT